MGSVQEEIIRLSKLLSEAEKRKDAATVSTYLAQDYIGIDPSGDLIDKATLVARYRADGFKLDTLRVGDIAVKAQQDSAWESGTMELAGNLGEKRFSGTYRYSHYWVRADAGWLITGSQMTPLGAPG